MDVQSAAAGLFSGNGHCAAVLAENAHSGFVQAREADVGDTAGEKCYAVTLCPFSRKGFAVISKKERLLDFRSKGIQFPEFAHAVSQFVQAKRLRDAKDVAGDAQVGSRRQQILEYDIPKQAFVPRTLDRVFDIGAG